MSGSATHGRCIKDESACHVIRMRARLICSVALLYHAVVCQVSHSLPVDLNTYESSLIVQHPAAKLYSNVGLPSHAGAFQTGEGRRSLLHRRNSHRGSNHRGQGVKVELRRREGHCGPQSSRSPDHERLHCAIQRSSLRANALRQRLKGRPVRGTKSGPGAGGGIAAGGFEAPVAAARGEYLATVRLGTPERIFSVVVDTGSDLTWVQCSPCAQCYPQNDSLFSPNNSTSYTKLACNSALCQGLPYPMCNNTGCVYWYAYGDGSLSTGDFVFDTITLDAVSGQAQQLSNFAFGCGHDNEGSFAGADGLLGLGQGSLSFPSQLKSVLQGKFSYCLVDWQAPATQTSPLLFGEAAVPTLPNVKYTGILTNPKKPTYYYVQLTGITVGGQLLAIPAGTFDIDRVGGGGTIFDSGTTVTQLTEGAYNAVLSAMNASTISYPRNANNFQGLDLCFSGTKAQPPKVPNLIFHFANADMEVPQSNYFIYLESSQSYCLSIAQSPDMSIIGSLQQQNFQVVYDTVAKRIGFVPKTCSVQ